jgi:hypothetical protein
MTRAHEARPTCRVVTGPGGKPFAVYIGAHTLVMRPLRSRSGKSVIAVPWSKLATRTYWAQLAVPRKPKARRKS